MTNENLTEPTLEEIIAYDLYGVMKQTRGNKGLPINDVARVIGRIYDASEVKLLIKELKKYEDNS